MQVYSKVQIGKFVQSLLRQKISKKRFDVTRSRGRKPPKMLILQQAGAGDVIWKITDVRLPYERVGRLP